MESLYNLPRNKTITAWSTSENILLKQTKTTGTLGNSYNYYEIFMRQVRNTYQYFSEPLRTSDDVHT